METSGLTEQLKQGLSELLATVNHFPSTIDLEVRRNCVRKAYRAEDELLGAARTNYELTHQSRS